jgi:multidrug resistance efflux pump
MPLHLPKIREDLAYTQSEEDGEVIFYVKDPLRGQFFRFNELQVAMMKLFDGKRGLEEIVDEVSVAFGQEIPAESVTRFVKKLERMYLLDITCYEVAPEQAVEKIRKLLRKRGLVWRELGRKKAGPVAQEQILFDQGLKRLEAGDPIGAASFMTAVLELQPESKRARDILRTIQEGYFASLKAAPSGLRMLFHFDPDRMLGALDKVLGPVFFGRLGPWVLVALTIATVAMCIDLKVTYTPDTVWVYLFAYFFYFLSMFIHEAAHGLACKHYGGRVNEIGFMVMFGFIPAAYCDTSDSYLFKDKRHKVGVQLAGSLGQAVWYVLVIALCYVTPETFWFRHIVVFVMALSSIQMWQNLMPLVRYDGYYALADWLELPNLRERAFDYMSAALKRSLLGIETKMPEVTPRERRIFLIYAAVAGVYTPLFVVVIWLQLLVPFILKTMHGVGFVMVVISGFFMFVQPVVVGLIKLALLVWFNRKQVFTPLRTIAFAAVAVALTVGLLHPWPLLIDGEMVVRPLERRSVAALEDGLVEEVAVREGEQVRAGQPLVRLKNLDLERERVDTATQLEKAKLQLALLESGARREELAAAQARRARSDAEKRFADLQQDRSQELVAAKLRTADEELRAQKDATLASSKVEVADLSLKLLRSGARPEDLQQAQATVRKLTAALAELDARTAHLTVVSPIDGTVVRPRIEELKGQRVQRGDSLFEVQDLRRIEAEIRLPPTEPMSGLRSGARVALRAHGDPSRLLEGRVQRIQPREGPSFAVVRTDAIDNTAGWPSGLTGHARIYGPNRSIAYVVFGVPLVQVWDFRTWVLWG